MAKPLTLVMVFAAGAVLGLSTGWMLRRSADIDEVARADRARAGLESAELRRLVDELREELRARASRPRVEAQGVPESVAVVAQPGGTEPPDEPSEAVSTELGTAEKESRIAALRAETPLWMERGDGEAAVAALRELAAIVPEGREAAMELALLINADVSGEGKLRLSDVQFYGGLGDPAVKSLMDWALVRPETPSGFRVLAAYSLPWVQAPSKTLEQFGRALGGETSPDVQRALVANLGRLKSPEAERLLGEILTDVNRDASLRAQVAEGLSTTSDEGLVRALEIAAEGDEDARVRDAARAALVARNPPASGYLVTGTLPESQAAAAGLRAGDVLVSYDGRETRSVQALQEASAEATGAGAETVTVVVVRGDQEVTLQLRPGRLGIYGRAVEATQK